MTKKKKNPNKLHDIPVRGILLVIFLSLLASGIIIYAENKKYHKKLDALYHPKHPIKKTKVKKLYEVPQLDAQQKR